MIKKDFHKENLVVQLGLPPVRVDVLTSLTVISWEDAYTNRVHGKYGEVLVSYIGRDEFISNKKAVGRQRDFADLEALGEE